MLLKFDKFSLIKRVKVIKGFILNNLILLLGNINLLVDSISFFSLIDIHKVVGMIILLLLFYKFHLMFHIVIGDLANYFFNLPVNLTPYNWNHFHLRHVKHLSIHQGVYVLWVPMVSGLEKCLEIQVYFLNSRNLGQVLPLFVLNLIYQG